MTVNDSGEFEYDGDAFYQAWMYDAFLTGRGRGKEIDLNKLSKAERKLFDASMAKEWANWSNFRAVTVVPPGEAQGVLARATSVIPSRWVHTNKGDESIPAH